MKKLFLLPLLFILACSKDEGLFDIPITPRGAPVITFQPSEACVGQPVTVVFDNGQGSSCGQAKIQRLIAGSWVTVAAGVPVNGLFTFTFTPDQAGVHLFRASWHGSGPDCKGSNVKWLEAQLVVWEDCCRDFFQVIPICDPDHVCPYGVEIHFMATMDMWVDIVGQFPPGVELCGIYADDGTIVDDRPFWIPGTPLVIGADVPACVELVLIVYFTGDRLESFGHWEVHDMSGLKFALDVPACD